MNLNTKNIYTCIFLLLCSDLYSDTGVDEILRQKIKDNGFIPAEQNYINPQANLSSIGKTFFESKHLSLNGKISCSTCHIKEKGLSDGIPNSAGVRGVGEGKYRLKSGAKIVPRNSIGLTGIGGKNQKVFFWDGRVDFSGQEIISQFGSYIPSPDPLVTAVHLPVVEIRETLEEDDFILAHKSESVSAAESVFKAINKNLKNNEKQAMNELATKLNKSFDDLQFIDVAKSIAGFIREEFKITENKLERFVFRNGKLSNDEIEGGIIFYGKGNCISCHSGPNFSNQKFYTIPFPQLGFGKNGFGIDYGRYNATFNPDDMYKFRTPSLINVSKTAPYGHSGSSRTLSEAIYAHFDPLSLINISQMNALKRHQFYKYLSKNDAADKVNFLTKQDVENVVKFLGTLDNE